MTQISSPHVLVYISCGSEENARQIAEALVQEQLAACVSILPNVQSVYRWQGQLNHDTEFLLMAKTRRDVLITLQDRVQFLHHYELPEIIAVPIEAGLEAYLNWINESVPKNEL